MAPRSRANCFVSRLHRSPRLIGSNALLRRMRRAIDRHSRRLKDVLLDDTIRKEFLNGAAKNDKAVVKAFVKSNSENALKTKPKGYDADHADLDLLRLRNYTIGRKLTDDEVLGEGGTARVAELLAALRPFVSVPVSWLNRSSRFSSAMVLEKPKFFFTTRVENLIITSMLLVLLATMLRWLHDCSDARGLHHIQKAGLCAMATLNRFNSG